VVEPLGGQFEGDDLAAKEFGYRVQTLAIGARTISGPGVAARGMPDEVACAFLQAVVWRDIDLLQQAAGAQALEGAQEVGLGSRGRPG